MTLAAIIPSISTMGLSDLQELNRHAWVPSVPEIEGIPAGRSMVLGGSPL